MYGIDLQTCMSLNSLLVRHNNAVLQHTFHLTVSVTVRNTSITRSRMKTENSIIIIIIIIINKLQEVKTNL